ETPWAICRYAARGGRRLNAKWYVTHPPGNRYRHSDACPDGPTSDRRVPGSSLFVGRSPPIEHAGSRRTCSALRPSVSEASQNCDSPRRARKPPKCHPAGRARTHGTSVALGTDWAIRTTGEPYRQMGRVFAWTAPQAGSANKDRATSSANGSRRLT